MRIPPLEATGFRYGNAFVRSPHPSWTLKLPRRRCLCLVLRPPVRMAAAWRSSSFSAGLPRTANAAPCSSCVCACDRGQRYCSLACRHRARLHQRRHANRRYQQSPEGRLDHRDRQRRYRQRQAHRARQTRVTDQGSLSIICSGIIRYVDRQRPRLNQSRSIPASSRSLKTRKPGREYGCVAESVAAKGRFVEPFPRIPRRR